MSRIARGPYAISFGGRFVHQKEEKKCIECLANLSRDRVEYALCGLVLRELRPTSVAKIPQVLVWMGRVLPIIACVPRGAKCLCSLVLVQGTLASQ